MALSTLILVPLTRRAPNSHRRVNINDMSITVIW